MKAREEQKERVRESEARVRERKKKTSREYKSVRTTAKGREEQRDIDSSSSCTHFAYRLAAATSLPTLPQPFSSLRMNATARAEKVSLLVRTINEKSVKQS